MKTKELTRKAATSNADKTSLPKKVKKSDTRGILERNQSLIADYATEYKSKFPRERGHVERLAVERTQALVRLAAIEEGFEAYTDDDFTPEFGVFMKRWNTVELESLQAFLRRPDKKDGDIWDFDSMSYSSAYILEQEFKVNYQQILRNTPCSEKLFHFGSNYIGIGYVDLCQLLWGVYHNESGGTLRFYGYDQAEVTVGRSVLMYEMMKAEEREVSEKTILQVWFSSCWDRETQEQFFSFLDKQVPRINNHLLSKYAPIWKAKKGMTVKQAQDAFTAHLRSCDFMPLNNLLVANDRIMFAKYLFTGCVFVDFNRPDDVICGNVTMFPGASESWVKVRREDFFNTVDMSAILRSSGSENNECKSVISKILNITTSKLKIFRSLVQDKKIVCKFALKEVRTDDSTFARDMKRLDPHFIDWSNIPDYYSRLEFIELARKCSGPDTQHSFHTMNWVCKVYGASFFDFIDRRELLEDMYSRFRLSARFLSQFSQAMSSQSLEGLVRSPKFDLPLNEFSSMAIELHGDNYLKHLMTDKKGKVLNFVRNSFNHYWQIFGDNDTVMSVTFSFNDEIMLRLADFAKLKLW